MNLLPVPAERPFDLSRASELVSAVAPARKPRDPASEREQAERTQPGRVLDSAERESFPDWSPDGSIIIYQNGEPGESAIYQIPATGGTPQALTGRQANFLPEWEPLY